MKKRGEITVFLSLVLVCAVSLLLGVVESARTAGARLYLRMAVDSAMDSLMSQYNRNLWEMYRLLCLEYENPAGIRESFDSYLDFYIEQKNFYPMRLEHSKVRKVIHLEDQGAKGLEEEILSYIKYRLPDVAENLAGIAQIPEETIKAGDFQTLIQVCRKAGKRTRKLEKARQKIEDCLERMRESQSRGMDAVREEREGKLQSEAGKLLREADKFPQYVKEYEKELKKLQEHLEGLKSQNPAGDAEAGAAMNQELMAYSEVETTAMDCLGTYKSVGEELAQVKSAAREALELLEAVNDQDEEDEEGDPDWSEIDSCWESIEIPDGVSVGERDEKKAAALDRLEELLDMDLLSLALPEGAEVSEKRVNSRGTPSSRLKGGGGGQDFSPEVLLVNEYIFLYFDSFVEKSREAGLLEDRPLAYEQEYILGGKYTDRENLRETAVQLLAVRGAMNLLYLLSSPDKKSSADALAAAVSAGSAPVQIVLSFFILSLWAFGEAVLDLRCLFDGGKVPIWKDDGSWRLGLEELLSLDFLNRATEGSGRGYDYENYMRVLLLMRDRQQKNYRLLDLIQWNVQKKQEDFRVSDCAVEIEMETTVRQRHVFFSKEEYRTTLQSKRKY